MELILIFLAAIAPGFFLLYSIYDKDKFRPEPIGEVGKGFLLGVGSAIVSTIFALIPSFMSRYFDIPLWSQLFDAFFCAALPEELAKLLMLWLLLKNNKYFDEYFDGIVYAVSISMGFATLENILYLLSDESWISVGIARGLISVPGHYGFAVLMGYYYSLYHFKHVPNLERVKCLIILAPVLAHGIFDALLMIANIADSGGVVIMIAFFIFVNKLRKKRQEKIAELINIDKINLE